VFFSFGRSMPCAEEAGPGAVENEPEEIVFTYSRQEAPKKEAAANIAVVTREDIEKLPATNVAEVLQYVTGVYVELNGGLGSQATASIQGSEARQVAVYQDGVPLNMLANPITDLSYLPVDVIERIEVYKGPASSAWGSSLGGVINIITREPNLSKNFKGQIISSYGQFDTMKQSAMFSGTAERLSYLLSLSHQASDGFVPFSEYRQDAAYAKMNYCFGQASRASFVYSYDEGRNADPSGQYVPPPYPKFWDDVFRRRAYQRLLFEGPLAENINVTVEGRHQEFDGSVDDVFTDRRMKYWEYSEDDWGVSARMSWDLGDANHFLAGIDGDWGQYDFSLYSKIFDSSNWAAYINDTYNLGRLSFTGGVRYDNNHDFGSAVSPSGGVAVRLWDKDALIRAQVARGFSAPPSAWAHDPYVGNPDLKPETALNYQIGCEARFLRFLHLEANLFRSDIDDYIYLILDETGLPKSRGNIGEVTRQGVEAIVAAAFASGFGLSFGGSYVDVRDAGTGDVITDVPRLILDASVQYTYKKWLTQILVGKWIDNNSSYAETHDKVFVFDYMLRSRLPWAALTSTTVNVFFVVHNLADSGYLYREFFPQPGRWFESGLSLEF
jgi:vitamin B12 transporter